METLNFKVKITDDELAMVRAYAEGTASTYEAHGRNFDRVVENIFVGKIGEVGFSKIFKCDKPKFEAHADPGYDFIIDGIKIDVKTLDEEYKKRVYISGLRAETYTVVMFDKDEKSVKFLGVLSTLYIRDNDLWHEGYVLRSHFEKNIPKEGRSIIWV